MKELTAILDSTVYKLLITRLIPGATAASSLLWLAASKQEHLQCLWTEYKVEIGLAATFVSLVVGLVVDELGLLLENKHFMYLTRNPSDSFEGANLTDEWYLYLRTTFPDNAGRSALKDLVLTLKFELNMGIALFLGALGLLLIDIPTCLRIGMVGGLWLIAAFLGIYSAHGSVDYLAQIRHEMLKGVREIGSARECADEGIRSNDTV